MILQKSKEGSQNNFCSTVEGFEGICGRATLVVSAFVIFDSHRNQNRNRNRNSSKLTSTNEKLKAVSNLKFKSRVNQHVDAC